jgi:hypothetical protein
LEIFTEKTKGKIGHNAQEKDNQFGFYSKKVAIILDSIPKRLYF